jgi:hypothetical protein
LYDEAFQLAADEDRDRSSVRFTPFVGYNFWCLFSHIFIVTLV